MDFLPLGLKLAGHTVVVVGGGDTALRKARLLHRAGARLDGPLRVLGREFVLELLGHLLKHRVDLFEFRREVASVSNV